MEKEYREKIEFTHDGEQYVFCTEPNPLNKSQMWWFEPQITMYAGTIGEAKAIAKNIKARMEE